MSTVMVYAERITPPDAYPCMTCREHGPYCVDCCPKLDAWRDMEARRDTTRPHNEGSPRRG